MGHEFSDAAALMRLVIATAALLAAVQFMLLPTLTDRFRQRLFETRRDLFILVAEGRIKPTHPAYVAVRGAINGLLRNAERLSFSKILVLGAVARKIGEERRKGLNAAIESIEDETAKTTVTEADKAISSAIVRYTVAKSPLAWILIVMLLVLVVLALLRRAQIGALRAARKLFRAELHKRVPTDGLQAEMAVIDCPEGVFA